MDIPDKRQMGKGSALSRGSETVLPKSFNGLVQLM